PRAIAAALARAPEHHRSAVPLICLAIGETTATNDVAASARDDPDKQSVKGMKADQLHDEGRHSVIWERIERIYSTNENNNERDTISRSLPIYN
ncbi:aminobenzoate oxygenase, partial [Pseudomonas syringae pv. tagetis]